MLSEKNQNFWQLASIQSSAQGLPVIIVGEILAEIHGAGTAFISIILGNLILWIIGLAMISMTYSTRSHALQNVRLHLGRLPTWFSLLALGLAFLTWFSFQLKGMTDAFDALLVNNPNWSREWSLKVGAFSGCIISLLAIGGIRLIKWVCVSIFPFLCLYIAYALFTYNGETPNFVGTWGFSLMATITAAAVTLPGVINLPTFFRHGRSKQDAYLAISLLVLFTIAFQASSIYLRFLDISKIVPLYSTMTGWTFQLVLLIGFISLSALCINLVNIYFASAVIEVIQPETAIDSKNYTLLGLAGTLLFGIVQITYMMRFIENLTGCYISVLGVTLLQAYLTEIIVKHRPRVYEKAINSLCLFIGCAVSTYVLSETMDQARALLAGIFSCVFAFIFMIFIEETIWSFRKLLDQRKEDSLKH